MSTSTQQESFDQQDEQGRTAKPKKPMAPQWEHVREGSRQFFNATAQAQAAEAARQRNDQHLRMRQPVDQGATIREQMMDLRAAVRTSGDSYLESLSKANVLAPGFNDDERIEQMDAMQRVYVRMMMQGITRPLKQGANVNAVLQSVGVFTALTLMSPEFREQLGSKAAPVRKALQDHIDARTRSKQEKADASGKTLGGRWAQRLEALEYKERGNRYMHTPMSAALAEVGLMENAAQRMRQPGLSKDQVEQIHGTYTGLRSRLHEQAQQDGLSREEVAKNVRTIIGNRIEAEPELASYYQGFAHGRVQRAPDHEIRLRGSNRNTRVWTGAFMDQHGRDLPQEGTPRLRKPMSMEEHQAHLADTMEATLKYSAARGDSNGYREDVMGYGIGFAAAGEQLDLSKMPTEMKQRFEAAEVSMSSMQMDGFTRQDMAVIFSSALTQAMERTHKEFPTFVEETERAWGATWTEQMSRVAQNPRRFVETLQKYMDTAQPSSQRRSRDGSDRDSRQQYSDFEQATPGREANDDHDRQPA